MRGRRLPTSIKHRPALQSKQLQPGLGSATHTLREAMTVKSDSYNHRTTMARHVMVPATTPHGVVDRSLPRHIRLIIFRATRLARGGTITKMARRGLSAAMPA
jgi:hypothetical protein